ncbi:uncharacterized protein LOC126369450 [Pectinophora gossypiella]|uniref:uncharacterized protein LOC126369450 n=1 Tax=Pectinophora gossypiella TaxID=13191 RepID=UPI00214E6676|nr:uncharacterized protein LOC126369450 [Pectinophora gossypiella]
MKNQQVSVDYWAMGKAMVTYGVLTALVWLMLRLVGAVFTLPRKLRAQQENMEATLRDLQRRYPDLNITEEDLKNAEKELEELTREDKDDFEIKDKPEKEETSEKDNSEKQGATEKSETAQTEESKKTI